MKIESEEEFLGFLVCTTIVRAIPQVESFLLYKLGAFDLGRTLFECSSSLTMVSLLLLLELANLGCVFTFVEVVEKEFIHFGLWNSKILQSVIKAELVLCSSLNFFIFLLKLLDSLLFILL